MLQAEQNTSVFLNTQNAVQITESLNLQQTARSHSSVPTTQSFRCSVVLSALQSTSRSLTSLSTVYFSFSTVIFAVTKSVEALPSLLGTMLGSCLSSCCSKYQDYEPLDDSIGNNADAEAEWAIRGRPGMVVVPPTANGSVSRLQLQPFLTSGRGVFYGTMSDASGERRTLGTRFLQHLRIYRGSSASGTSEVASCSDPNPRTLKFPGKIAIGKHKSFNEKILLKRPGTDEPKNPEQVILDQIVEEAAANMININQSPYSYLSVKEVRTRQKFYELMLNQTDPNILKKNMTTCVNLLTDCDFITRNRLMKFGDRCEGIVSWKDRNLLDWALKDLDEIVSCMAIETEEEIAVPFPDWTFEVNDNETQEEVPVPSLV